MSGIDWCRLTIGNSTVTTHQVQSPTRVSNVVDHVVDTPCIYMQPTMHTAFTVSLDFKCKINGGLNFA